MNKVSFKAKVIAANTIVLAAIIIAVCFFVVNGIYGLSYDMHEKSLKSHAYAINNVIYQTIMANEGAIAAELSSHATSLAETVFSKYNITCFIYDTEAGFLASSETDFPEALLSPKAKSAVAGKYEGVYALKHNGINHIAVFAPLADAQAENYGMIALLWPMRQEMKTTSRVITVFAIIGVFFAIISVLVYNSAYKVLFKPFRELGNDIASFPKDGSKFALRDVYSKEDELQGIIAGVNGLIEHANERSAHASSIKFSFVAGISALQDAVVAINLLGEPMVTNDKFSQYFPSDTDYFAVVSYIDEAIKKAHAGNEPIDTEFELDERNFLATACPVPGIPNSSIAVIKDVTSIKKMEQAQRKFISSISHELRTPLTTIKGYIDLLERRGTGDPEVTSKALATTSSEIARLLRLVDELLNLDSYSSMEFDLIFSNIAPDELIAEAVAQMNMASEETGILVHYNRISLPNIKGDRDRLKQVFLNIIDNAVKYSDPGNAVRVIASFDAEFLEVAVRDYGVGIPSNMQEKVFDTFYRVEEDRSRLRGGVGLGLSIVRNIVRRHNGSVSIESLPDQGTLVTLKLPLAIKKEGSEDAAS
ncbi:MAG: HAMP domain-containing histidine kinase [Eubacteriaceae bacterium]|nr:HAMP domain-containing histidine kinase [Eubacteriaceae bacterium]